MAGRYPVEDRKIARQDDSIRAPDVSQQLSLLPDDKVRTMLFPAGFRLPVSEDRDA
jgi:hypothetical protein